MTLSLKLESGSHHESVFCFISSLLWVLAPVYLLSGNSNLWKSIFSPPLRKFPVIWSQGGLERTQGCYHTYCIAHRAAGQIIDWFKSYGDEKGLEGGAEAERGIEKEKRDKYFNKAVFCIGNKKAFYLV